MKRSLPGRKIGKCTGVGRLACRTEAAAVAEQLARGCCTASGVPTSGILVATQLASTLFANISPRSFSSGPRVLTFALLCPPTRSVRRASFLFLLFPPPGLYSSVLFFVSRTIRNVNSPCFFFFCALLFDHRRRRKIALEIFRARNFFPRGGNVAFSRTRDFFVSLIFLVSQQRANRATCRECWWWPASPTFVHVAAFSSFDSATAFFFIPASFSVSQRAQLMAGRYCIIRKYTRSHVARFKVESANTSCKSAEREKERNGKAGSLAVYLFALLARLFRLFLSFPPCSWS